MSLWLGKMIISPYLYIFIGIVARMLVVFGAGNSFAMTYNVTFLLQQKEDGSLLIELSPI